MLTRANIVLNFYTVRFESNFVCVDPSPDLCTLHCTLLWHSVLTHADSPPAIGIRAISPIPCHWRQSPSSQLILRTVAGPKQPGAICQEKNAVCSKNLWGTTKKNIQQVKSHQFLQKKRQSPCLLWLGSSPMPLVFVALEAIAGQQTRQTLHLWQFHWKFSGNLYQKISYHLHGYLLASYRLLVDIAGRRYDAPWHFCCRNLKIAPTCSWSCLAKVC